MLLIRPFYSILLLVLQCWAQAAACLLLVPLVYSRASALEAFYAPLARHLTLQKAIQLDLETWRARRVPPPAPRPPGSTKGIPPLLAQLLDAAAEGYTGVTKAAAKPKAARTPSSPDPRGVANEEGEAGCLLREPLVSRDQGEGAGC